MSANTEPQPLAIVAKALVAQRVVYDVLVRIPPDKTLGLDYKLRIKAQNYHGALLLADSINAFGLSVELERGGIGE